MPNPESRPAAIWLQLEEEQETSLRALIERLANAHGTVPFQPHLTVCTLSSEDVWDAAAGYVQHNGTLPLVVRKKGVSFSTTVPMMAVVIDVEDTPNLRAFRENLRQIVHAPAPTRPHISLFYSVDEAGHQLRWSLDEHRLKDIAEECAHCVHQNEFVLARPIIVAPDRDWQAVRSWKVARALRA